MNPLHIEALRNYHRNLVEVTAELHSGTVSAPRNTEWDKVSNLVNELDSIAHVMKQALDA